MRLPRERRGLVVAGLVAVVGLVGIPVTVVALQAPGTGFVEVCKAADGPTVTGVFRFTVGGVTVDVPVGACSPVISLPAGTVTVTEIERAGISVSAVQTSPPTRLVSSNLAARSAQVQVVEGDESTQTTVTFTNRAELAILKICKVAGTGIAVGTNFSFTAGTVVVSVPAGSPPGGTCTVVGWFPVATNVAITESIPAGTEVSAIVVAPGNRIVGSPNLPGGSVVVRIGSGVTEATFTNRVPPPGSTTTTTVGVNQVTTTTSPGGGSTTTLPGAATTTLPGGLTTTTVPGGLTTTTLPGGLTTTIPPGATTTTPGTGATTTTIGGGGGATTTLPGGGGTTTTLPGGGVTTTTLPGGGVTTTIGGGGATTTTPGGGGVTTTLGVSGVTTTTIPGGGGGVTTTIGGGGGPTTTRATSATTVPGGGGSTTTTAPCEVTSTTVPTGPGSTTTIGGGGGQPTTTIGGGGGQSTTTIGGGGQSTTTIGGGGQSTTTMGGGGGQPTTTTPSGPGSTTTIGGGGQPTTTMGAGGQPTTTLGGGRQPVPTTAPPDICLAGSPAPQAPPPVLVRAPSPGPFPERSQLATTGRRIGQLVLLGFVAVVLGGLLVQTEPQRVWGAVGPALGDRDGTLSTRPTAHRRRSRPVPPWPRRGPVMYPETPTPSRSQNPIASPTAWTATSSPPSHSSPSWSRTTPRVTNRCGCGRWWSSRRVTPGGVQPPKPRQAPFVFRQRHLATAGRSPHVLRRARDTRRPSGARPEPSDGVSISSVGAGSYR